MSTKIPKQGKRKKGEPKECCKFWAGEPSEDNYPERLLHMLAHSRVGFTTKRFATDASIEFEAAERMCADAERQGWVYVGHVDGRLADDAGAMWVGNL